MAEYRAYILSPDGRITKAVDIFCDDDATAKEKARKLVDGQDIELWQRDRKIARFQHKSD